jgi:predicted ATPase/transcriptional regulator with XRE-family HTH domain
MTASDSKGTIFSTGDDDLPQYFSEWLKHRRQELDLTQAQLAKRASCSVFAIRKIELGERRPSRQLAGLLAQALEIPSEERANFIKVARGELSLDRLSSLDHTTAPDSRPASTPGNLPRELTLFIGREPELSALGQLLEDAQCQLLTIIGPGGIGKTRLAVAAAQHAEDLFPDGVWFVPLVSLNSAAQIVPAIADAVDFRFQDPTNLQAQLLRYLRTKKTLLVLDNAEHLLDGVGVFTEILKDCQQIKLLVTSRERLNLLSEWVFDLQGLPVPPNDKVEQFEAYSSVALFLQSARRVQAGFVLREADRRCVLKICQITEGMPLGIELAAAWVGLLSCEEISREIEHNLDFLSVSMRDLPERHRSLRATLDHSWQRLPTKEQQVLSQLSVFRGGFSRQAAEQVAGASLTVLSTFVNRTLLRRVAPGRYGLHELIRQYCAAHLAADPQALAATQTRHYAFFLALAEAAEQGLKGRDQLEWMERLEHEHDNLQAALEWALESDRTAPDRDEKALRLSGVLRWFWRMRGHFHEGLSWLTRSLQQHPERQTAARAVALLGKSQLVNALGDLGAARLPAEESAAIYRDLGDQHGLAEALAYTGFTLIWQGEARPGQARLEEALAIYRKSSDRWGEAMVLYRLGSCLADYAGDPTGRAMLEESVVILEDSGEKYILTSVLISLGIIDMGFGDYAAARARLEHALAIAREIEHPWGVADALTNLGCVSRILGEFSTARSHLEQSLKVYHEHGRSIWETDVLCALAENALSQGDLSTARFHLQEASNLSGSGDNKWLQMLVCYFQGLLAYYEGDAVAAMKLLDETTARARQGRFKPDLARSLVALGRVNRTLGQVLPSSALLIEGLDLFRALGHKLGIAEAIEELGAVRVIQGNCMQAVMLFSAAHVLRQEMGAPIPPVDRADHGSAVAACKAQLGETAFTEAWAYAASRSFQEVVEEVLKPEK